MIIRATCLDRCFKKHLGAAFADQRVLPEIEAEFKQRLPYQYLNVAYFNLGRLSDAVAAAYTYFNANPMPVRPGEEPTEGQLTLDFYNEVEGVTAEMYVDLETHDYFKLYERASHAYQLEEWENAIDLFKRSLKEYYLEAEGCRGLCEKPYDFGEAYPNRLPHFHRLQVNHLSQMLQCRLQCVKQMELPTGEYNRFVNSDFLPVYYHYLMFASHEVGQHEEALKYFNTYMMFHANDARGEYMMNNRQYLEVQDRDNVAVDGEAKTFHTRAMRDVAMLRYMEKHLGMEFDHALLTPFPDENLFDKENEEMDNEEWDVDLNTQTPWDPDYESKEPIEVGPVYKTPFVKDNADDYESMQEKIDDILFDPLAGEGPKTISTPHGELPDYDVGEKFGTVVRLSPMYQVFTDGPEVEAEGPVPEHATLKLNSTLMQGPTRFVMDDLLTEEECGMLLSLGDVSTIGDGYDGDPSPHSTGEHFFGITLLRAAELAQEDKVSKAAVQLYHDINFKLAKIVQEYFKLEQELYTDYVHLVCRSPTDDVTTDEDGNEILSHPIHPDNCLYLVDGTCPRREPAYIWREYSAVLYLNGDIEGGEVLFADKSGKYALNGVKPKCGRLVGFCAGTDCLHGVRKMTKVKITRYVIIE